MVIAGLLNNDFKPWKINEPITGTRWDPQAEGAGVGGPLAVSGRNITNLLAI